MEDDLEGNLWLELEKIDQIFSDENMQFDNATTKHRKSYTAYELAEAEGEKEQLEDRLHELLHKTEDFDAKLLELTQRNFDLSTKNEKLIFENSILIQQIADLNSIHKANNNTTNAKVVSETDLQNIEFKLAETRSKLARTLQTFDDLTLIKDHALKQLEQERMARIHVEKERDAYSAAYEASLTHFDKWSRSKSHK